MPPPPTPRVTLAREAIWRGMGKPSAGNYFLGRTIWLGRFQRVLLKEKSFCRARSVSGEFLVVQFCFPMEFCQLARAGSIHRSRARGANQIGFREFMAENNFHGSASKTEKRRRISCQRENGKNLNLTPNFCGKTRRAINS